MILERKALDLAELESTLKDVAESDKKTEIEAYLKKFLKTKPESAKKITQELEALDMLKLKKEHIIKIIDLLPEDASDLNKIFSDTSLSEDETNKILEIVKNNK
ncbi:MAG: hypothetical protein ACP5OG_01825 [Candidatus Nanoarchaeia archaeon]